MSCAHCSQPYYLHGLNPRTQSPPHAMTSSSSPPSVPIPPTFMMPGMFSDPSTALATQEHMRSAPSMRTTTTASFQAWTPNNNQSDSTLNVNERRQEAAQRHRPPPRGIPAPARGVAQNPLYSLPTISLPHGTTTSRMATRTQHASSSRNTGRTHFGTTASQSQASKPKVKEYRYACIITPASVSSILL